MAEPVQANKTASFYIKRISGLILLLALAAVFFVSAISKLYTLEPFTWTFMDMGINSVLTGGIIARLFIGVELLVGLFLLLHVFLRSFTYKATLAMLVLLTLYLVLLIVQQGNTGNCGCFGTWLYMKPMAAIWKNLALIAVTILLYFIYPVKPYKNQEWIAGAAVMAALVFPFVFNPLDVNNQPELTHEAIDLNPLYQSAPAPVAELRTGKHIVAFMSLTCPHCRKAAYLLQIIHYQHPQLPIFLVLNGPASVEDDFFKETHATTVPHLLYKNMDGFLRMAGPYVPAIFWVNNSIIERKSTYYQLDPQTMEQWVKE